MRSCKNGLTVTCLRLRTLLAYTLQCAYTEHVLRGFSLGGRPYGIWTVVDTLDIYIDALGDCETFHTHIVTQL